jgi:hypothetical protein
LVDLFDCDTTPVFYKFQSNSLFASADPLSQSTVCDEFLCDMHCDILLDKLVKDTLLPSASEGMY